MTYLEIQDILNRRLLEESAKYTDTEIIKTDIRKYKCSVVGCDRNGYAYGFCNAHYIRDRKGMDMSLPIKNRKKNGNCIICGKKTNSKGGWNLCTNHYRATRSRVIKETIVSILGGVCIVCGNKLPIVCYDLHHIDPTQKEFTVSSKILNGSIEAIAMEVSKCELICANCHRIKHYSNGLS